MEMPAYQLCRESRLIALGLRDLRSLGGRTSDFLDATQRTGGRPIGVNPLGQFSTADRLI